MNINNIRIARQMSCVVIAGMMVFLAACGQTPASPTPITRTTLTTTTAATTTSLTTQFTPVTPTTSATIPSVTASTTVATTPATTPTTPATPPTTTFATPPSPTTPATTPTLSTTTLTPIPATTSTIPTTTQVTVVTTTATTPPTTTQTGTTPVVSLIAQGLAFDKKVITVLAGSAITINFENRDAVAHNFALYVNSSATLSAIFQGQSVTGPASVTYRFLAPTTPGVYFFRCDFHPQTMTGSFVVVGTAS